MNGANSPPSVASPPKAMSKSDMNHDKAIEEYSLDLLLDVYGDLGRRVVTSMKDPEHRWIMARRSAVLRRLRILTA